MEHFFIMYAPPLSVFLTVIGLFIWGAKSKSFEGQDNTPKRKLG